MAAAFFSFEFLLKSSQLLDSHTLPINRSNDIISNRLSLLSLFYQQQQPPLQWLEPTQNEKNTTLANTQRGFKTAATEARAQRKIEQLDMTLLQKRVSPLP